MSEGQRAALRGVKFEVAELPGQYLGEAAGTRLRVDSDAGGSGWFIDATPLEDHEFMAADSTRRYSLPTAEPAGRIDLLTTILHEQGHVLGLEDRYGEQDRDSVMFGYLSTGERRLPALGQAADVAAHHCDAIHFLSGPVAIGTLPPGKSVRVSYSVTIANPTVPANALTITNTGTVTAAGGLSVVTDDPELAGSQSTVTKIAVAPVLSSLQKNSVEDSTVPFFASEFNSHFSDGNGDALASVQIVTLPASGTLKVGADNASVGQVIPAASLNTLSFEPAANDNGTVNFSWNASDGTLFAANAALVSISFQAVNDKPSFTASNITVNEDPGPQTVVGWASFNPGGGADEAGQTATYTVTNLSRSDQFSVPPAVSPNGTLTYTLAADRYVGSTFDVQVNDGGGGATPNSTQLTFTLTVDPVNDKPVITGAPGLPTVNEDAAEQVVPDFITGFQTTGHEGDIFELGLQQFLAYHVSNVSNPAFFAAGPAVDSFGRLTYTPAANASGSVTFEVCGQDDGGTANGGIDLSDPHVATLTINPINDKPGFSASNPPAVNEDAGAQSVVAWASFSSGGGSFESGQTASAYTVSNVSNAALFSASPSVAANGTLSYTPAANANGSSSFQVRVQDNGGTADGGVDLSDVQTFTITVNAVNNSPHSPRITPEPGGGWRIGFTGNPNASYTIQYSANLVQWQTLGPATADASGHCSIVDVPPPGFPIRFYRAAPP